MDIAITALLTTLIAFVIAIPGFFLVSWYAVSRTWFFTKMIVENRHKDLLNGSPTFILAVLALVAIPPALDLALAWSFIQRK